MKVAAWVVLAVLAVVLLLVFQVPNRIAASLKFKELKDAGFADLDAGG